MYTRRRSAKRAQYTLVKEPYCVQTSSSKLIKEPYCCRKLNPTPYTAHPTPYTLHPTLYTLHPTPYTLLMPKGARVQLATADEHDYFAYFNFVVSMFLVQPAMADEDDPLLAEALAASLRDGAGAEGGGGAGGGGTEEDTRSMIERFPALRAQVFGF